MQQDLNCKVQPLRKRTNLVSFKTFRVMKNFRAALIALAILLSAESYSQKISISVSNTPLEKVFKLIEQQTQYKFVYTDEALAVAKPVSINIKNETLGNALNLCFANQPLSYSLNKKMIIIKENLKIKDAKTSLKVRGTITDQNGEPLAGASIEIKGTEVGTITNEKGAFSLENIKSNSTLVISNISYETLELPVEGKVNIDIKLKPVLNTLDETLVIAYGKVTQRYNTGSVSKVSSDVIAEQPVANPLAALEGRVPGLVVTQSNGLPGSFFKVQIRGQNSLAQGSDPLFIIDGVPFAPNNTATNQISSAAGANGLSPFNSINPNDIESIEILKDADATAIYGSRGANGVVLITTKKGKTGKTLFSLNIYSGVSSVTRTMPLMNTQQYLQMRHEAFINDNIMPDENNAPDLLVWDTAKYTDIKKLLIGGSAHVTDVSASVSGGSDNTQFLFGSSIHHQTTVFPGDLADNRGAFNLNVNHSSGNQKFHLNLSAIYSAEKNTINASDLTSFINLPPDLPSLHDSAGNLNWQYKAVGFDNPLSYLLQKYTAETDNLLSNLLLSYKFLSNLTFRVSTGYNYYFTNEVNTNPIASQNPAYSPQGYSQFGSNLFKSWIVEPQAEYEKSFSQLKINALVGGTVQQTTNINNSFFAYGYSNDALLQSMKAATTLTVIDDNYRQYRYAAMFGRLNINLQNKYLLNISGRRDGSSRFGPGNRFANFGAVGVAWIFSSENFFKNNISILSFGKLRGSYGTTGNDQIGDYQYLDSWTPTDYSYGETSGLEPTQLYNSTYSWEVNKKLEGAIDLEFFKAGILFSFDYYNNRSGNQLIQYALPAQTGFTSIINNFPALIQNSGIEISVTAKEVDKKNFKWSTTVNFTIPHNKLIKFPGLETSTYASIYQEGQSLSLLKGLHYEGVNKETGIFQFADINQDGHLDSKDYLPFGNLDPKFYGGFENRISYKGLQLEIFIEFRKQLGRNFLGFIYNPYVLPPGTMGNQPTIVLSRWQASGDNTSIQKYSSAFGTPAFTALNYLSQSDAVYSDASYARLKNVSLSYVIPSSFLKKTHLTSSRIFIQAQNILTITKYKGSDPETQNLYALPPLKTFTAGIQFTL